MNIKRMLGGGKKSMGCYYDAEIGQTNCERKEVHADGTTTTVSNVKLMTDGACNVIPIEMTEQEEGELQPLQKFSDVYTRNKCVRGTRRPQE